MPTDIPTFPGETHLPLSGATRTGVNVTNGVNAFDDDPATFATFTPFASVSVPVPLNQNTWIDTGVVIPAGGSCYITATGSGTADDFGTPLVVNPGGAVPPFPIIGEQGGSGYWAAEDIENLDMDESAYCLVVAAQAATLSPTARDLEPTSLRRLFCPGNGTRYLFVNSQPDAVTIYTQFNGLGDFYANYAGTFTLILSAAPRSLRADFGDDYFVTRVRLRMAGSGAPNAAIALKSGFVDDADVTIAYIPLPSDESGTSGTDEITITPPVLADGIIFYPDYLAPSDSLDSDIVQLYQLQVYTTERETMPNPTQTTTVFSQVGIQEAFLYPYNGVTGPYDSTTEHSFTGNQTLEMALTTALAVVTGGETVFELGAFETGRPAKFKFSAMVTNLRVLAILQGGRFNVDTAGANGGEVQHLAPNKSDRAPYFRFVGRSTNGDGTLSVILPKCKISSAPTYNLQKDGVSTMEFEFTAFWDPTHVTQDGRTGGICELVYGDNAETTYTS